MEGTVLITGANGSLAIPAVAHLLSKYPSYTAVLTTRNPAPTDPNTKRLLEIISTYPPGKTSLRKLDLGSLADIKSFVSEIKNDIKENHIPPVVAIICNAFTWSINSGIQYTSDGYETTMAVNYLGHLALVLQLLDVFPPQGGRIVFLSSETHSPGKAALEKYPPVLPANFEKLVHPDPDIPGDEAGRGFQRYGFSKSAVLMGMYALQRRLAETSMQHPPITLLANDPGGIFDSRAFHEDHIPWSWSILFTIFLPILPLLQFRNPRLRRARDAAPEIIEMAVGEAYARQEGHFNLGKQEESSPDSLNEDMQERLWEKSLSWIGITQVDTLLKQ